MRFKRHLNLPRGDKMNQPLIEKLRSACAAIDVECVEISHDRYELITPITTLIAVIRNDYIIVFTKDPFYDGIKVVQPTPDGMLRAFDHLCFKYVERCAAKKTELALANIAAKVDRILEENARLMQENAELRLLPDAPEYYATKAHFESLERAEN